MKQQIFVVKKEEVVSIGDHRRLQLWSTVFCRFASAKDAGYLMYDKSKRTR